MEDKITLERIKLFQHYLAELFVGLLSLLEQSRNKMKFTPKEEQNYSMLKEEDSV
jgi:hypothetical protein